MLKTFAGRCEPWVLLVLSEGAHTEGRRCLPRPPSSLCIEKRFHLSKTNCLLLRQFQQERHQPRIELHPHPRQRPEALRLLRQSGLTPARRPIEGRKDEEARRKNPLIRDSRNRQLIFLRFRVSAVCPSGAESAARGTRKPTVVLQNASASIWFISVL